MLMVVQRERPEEANGLTYYYCTNCQKWHLGHDRMSRWLAPG